MAKLIDYGIVGRNIYKFCKEKHITQKEVERLCGYSNSRLSGYVSGRYVPTIATLMEIASVLNVDVRDFFTESKDDLYSSEILDLYYGMSETMQVAVREIMKATQEGK